MTITPNIFDYATSELSQDAFICYFLSFGKKEFNGSKEYIAAHKFLRECGIEEDVKEIHTQYKHIDVLVETENYLLIIEDKTYTNEHGDQILHYVNNLKCDELNKESKPKAIVACYLKTADYLHKYKPNENKMKDLNIQEDDFKYYSLKREDIMNFIKDSNDFIFQSFYIHLQNYSKKCDVNDLSTWSKSDWFEYLKQLFDQYNIYERYNGYCDINSYVSNPSGGFYATHFDWQDLPEEMQKYSDNKQTKAGIYNQLELFFSDGKTSRINLSYRFHSNNWNKEETKRYRDERILSKLQERIKEKYENGNRMGASTAYKFIKFENINKETTPEILAEIKEFIKYPIKI